MSRRLVALALAVALLAAACGSSGSAQSDAAQNPGGAVDSTSSTAAVDDASPSATTSDAGDGDRASEPAPTTTQPAETTTTPPPTTQPLPEPIGDANQRLTGELDTLLTGTTIDLATFHNQDVVLWMWAPW